MHYRSHREGQCCPAHEADGEGEHLRNTRYTAPATQVITIRRIIVIIIIIITIIIIIIIIITTTTTTTTITTTIIIITMIVPTRSLVEGDSNRDGACICPAPSLARTRNTHPSARDAAAATSRDSPCSCLPPRRSSCP
jgi:hypothetical protein